MVVMISSSAPLASWSCSSRSATCFGEPGVYRSATMVPGRAAPAEGLWPGRLARRALAGKIGPQQGCSGCRGSACTAAGPGTVGGPRSVPFGRIFSPASTATGSWFPAVYPLWLGIPVVLSPLARHRRRPLPSGSASPPSPPLWLGIPAVPSPLARHPRRPSKPALPRFSRASGAGKPSRFTCRTSCHSIFCSIDCGYVMVSIERGEGLCQLSHFPVTGSPEHGQRGDGQRGEDAPRPGEPGGRSAGDGPGRPRGPGGPPPAGGPAPFLDDGRAPFLDDGLPAWALPDDRPAGGGDWWPAGISRNPGRITRR